LSRKISFASNRDTVAIFPLYLVSLWRTFRFCLSSTSEIITCEIDVCPRIVHNSRSRLRGHDRVHRNRYNEFLMDLINSQTCRFASDWHDLVSRKKSAKYKRGDHQTIFRRERTSFRHKRASDRLSSRYFHFNSPCDGLSYEYSRCILFVDVISLRGNMEITRWDYSHGHRCACKCKTRQSRKFRELASLRLTTKVNVRPLWSPVRFDAFNIHRRQISETNLVVYQISSFYGQKGYNSRPRDFNEPHDCRKAAWMNRQTTPAIWERERERKSTLDGTDFAILI